MSDAIICPKCKAEQDDAPVGFGDGSPIVHCEKCDFSFHVTIEHVVEYSTECVSHDWSVWRRSVTHPASKWWHRFCGLCDKCESRIGDPNEDASE